MRVLSAAIIAATGLFCFTLGSFIPHGDTQVAVMCVAGVIGLLGLMTWAWMILASSNPPAP